MARTITVSGILEKCDLRKDFETDFNYSHKYSPNTEHYIIRLDCTLKTTEGCLVYFKTPGSKMRVTSCPGAAVVTFGDVKWDETTRSHVFPKDNPWFNKEGDMSVATREQATTVHLTPKFKKGDRLTIQGRIKTEKPSAIQPYVILNHVKLIP